MPERVIKTFYSHSQPFGDEMCDLWPPEAEQQEVIHYLGYEDPYEAEIDLDTGKWRYLSFNGVPLEHPTKWFPGGTDEP